MSPSLERSRVERPELNGGIVTESEGAKINDAGGSNKEGSDTNVHLEKASMPEINRDVERQNVNNSNQDLAGA